MIKEKTKIEEGVLKVLKESLVCPVCEILESVQIKEIKKKILEYVYTIWISSQRFTYYFNFLSFTWILKII